MKRFFVLVFCMLGVLAGARAHQSDPPPNFASLTGMVVKEPGSQPLKKVLLHLIAEDQKTGGNYTADTDSEGRFRIEKIQPGRYRLMLEKTGFHQINLRGHQAEGSILSVQAGQEIGDLLLQMLPSAVITGKVVDEDGEPLPYYQVSLLKKRPGKSRGPEVAGEDRTNDLGEYRFSGLFPGQYFVAVVPPPDLRNFVHASQDPHDPDSKPDWAYLTTYYPGTNDASQAAAIDLRAGDEMPINFSLVPARSYRIRGMLTGIPANQKPGVQLISKSLSPAMNGADVSADGQFEIRGVTPGSYFIVAYAGSEGELLSARQSVTVVAADVEGVKLVPVRPFTVTGHLRFDGRAPRDITSYSMYFQPERDPDDSNSSYSFGRTSVAQADRFGNIQWTGVVPGNYTVQVNTGADSDSFLKSVTLGSSNADTGFTVTGPASVELVMSSKGGVLEGAVLDRDKPAANATVVAVPEEKYRKIHERFGVGAADQNGHFAIRGLAPGSYAVFAWQDLDDGLYGDPAFLKSQESNEVALKIEEGSQQKIELKVSPVGDEWQ